MKTIKTNVLIIGAGLTGMTLAYYLQKINVNVKIVEARNRLGGRIYTKLNPKQAPIELGATWLIPQQNSMLNLLKELNIDVFTQHYGKTAIYQPNPNQAAQLVQLPASDNVSYRIKDGTQSIINALENTLIENTILLNQNIETIRSENNILLAKTADETFHAKHIISTLPPLLFLKSIKVEPALPEALTGVMTKTHTWVKDSIRSGFTYKNPFWKTGRTSGTIYSTNTPLQEYYDHSDSENHKHAIGGFMSSSVFEISKEKRQQLALRQLQKYYGDDALDFKSYEECVWKNEKFTVTKSDFFLMPQQNNGHPLYKKAYLNKRLSIAGAETSSIFSGKMEGAINSANFVYNQLKGLYKT